MTNAPAVPAPPPELAQLTEAIKLLTERLTASKQQSASRPPQQQQQQGSGLGQAAAALGKVAATAGAVVGAILTVIAVTQEWVQALKPGLITQFNQALTNLKATLGVAFTGIFEQGIKLFQGVAATVAPVMQQLKPIVDQIAKTALKNLLTSVQAIVPVLTALVPVVQALALVSELMGAMFRPFIAILGLIVQVALAPFVVLMRVANAVLGPLISVFSEVHNGVAGIIETLGTLFGVFVDTLGAAIGSLLSFDLVKDVIKTVSDAFTQFRNAIITTAARLALMLGQGDFVRRLIGSLSATGAKAGTDEQAAPTSIKGLEQIGKDLAQASVGAKESVSEKPDAKNSDIIKTLNDMIEANGRNATDLREAILSMIPGGQTIGEAAKFFDDPVGYAGSAVQKQLDKPGVFGYTSLNPF